MRVACWINKVTRTKAHARARAPTLTHVHTHTKKHVIVVVFRRQKWLRERALMLRYTYIASLVLHIITE